MTTSQVQTPWIALVLLACLMFAGCRGGDATSPGGRSKDKTSGDAAPRSGPVTLYVGTYTDGQSKGIYRLVMDSATGILSQPELAAETKNPSFLAISPKGEYLYSVGEIDDFEGGKTGAVHAFAIDARTGNLSPINHAESGGAGPCHVSVDKTGRNVLVANYGAGTVARLVAGDGGKLIGPMAVIEFEGSGPNKGRQEKPHAHYISPDVENEFVLACDLGTDQVMIFRFDSIKGLIPTDPPAASVTPGSGPRHLDFHPSGKYVYVINELDNTITAFAYDAMQGVLTEIGVVTTLPPDFTGNNSTAEIAVHPSGRFVYGSNRGHDSIAVFRVDDASGKLIPAGHAPSGGETPRNFAIDPSGQFLIAANQKSDSLVVFQIDLENGSLTPTGATANVPAPVCVAFMPRVAR